MKNTILRNAPKLKSYRPLQNSNLKVFIGPDLTRSQQIENKRLRDELQRRRNMGENVVISRGRIIRRTEQPSGGQPTFTRGEHFMSSPINSSPISSSPINNSPINNSPINNSPINNSPASSISSTDASTPPGLTRSEGAAQHLGAGGAQSSDAGGARSLGAGAGMPVPPDRVMMQPQERQLRPRL